MRGDFNVRVDEGAGVAVDELGKIEGMDSRAEGVGRSGDWLRSLS